MPQQFIRTIKNLFYVTISLFNLSSCISKPIPECCAPPRDQVDIRSYKPDINKDKKVLIGTSNIEPFISLNNNGDGIIIWDGEARKLNNYVPDNNKIIIDDNLLKSSIIVDSKGNGLLIWSSNVSQDKTVRLYGQMLKEYIPINEKFLISDINISDFKVDTNSIGNGLIIWQNNEKKTYGYDINNFIINSDNLREFNESNINELYISENNIKKLYFNLPEGYLFYNEPKLNSSGNGYVTWVNNQQDLILKSIDNYKIDNNEFIISKRINTKYNVDLDAYGYGLLVWYRDENLYVETINAYSSIKTDKISLSNKTVSYASIKLNEKRNGLITYIDNYKNLYIKKILVE